MLFRISKDRSLFTRFQGPSKWLVYLSIGIIFILFLTVFQDFLESRRSGYLFNLSESLLFNIFWVLSIPILFVLQRKLRKYPIQDLKLSALFILGAIAVHLTLLPFIASIISFLFYHAQYSFYKFLTYSISHDLYKLFIIYTGFVLGHRFVAKSPDKLIEEIPAEKKTVASILVQNGKEKILVKIEDIYAISSASPYVCLQLEHKEYLHNATLKSMSETLDENQFVQIHKSTLINISKLNSFKSRLNGDYDLFMSNGKCLRLSRTYAANFKSRLLQLNQVEQ